MAFTLKHQKPLFMCLIATTGFICLFYLLFTKRGESFSFGRLTTRTTQSSVTRPKVTNRTSQAFYLKLLKDMGYPPLHARSQQEEAQLQHFFKAVRHFAFSRANRQIMIELLRQFQIFCEKNKVPFFLIYGGTLGAFRHHGLIPWDDDVDAFVPLSSLPKFQKLLHDHPILQCADKTSNVFPVFFKDKKKSHEIHNSKWRKWRWPYIEVHFYNLHDNKLSFPYSHCGAANVSNYFPLIHVPFEDMTLPAPRHIDCLVHQCYKNAETRCCTQRYSHTLEKLVIGENHCIDCKLLKPIFPFVSSRHRQGEFVVEKVSLNGSVIRTRRVKKPKC